MKIALNRAQMRLLDKIAIEEYGIPGIVLMENAARSAAAEALSLLGEPPNALPGRIPRAAIVCGGGNNGGDGFAIARHLHNAGIDAAVYCAADPAKLTGDALINWNIVSRMNLRRREILSAPQLIHASREWNDADLIVDALLGTGFTGNLREHTARVIERINSASDGRRILAVDLPSGLDCDTGAPSNPTVRAHVTVTFAAPKIGFAAKVAQQFLGRVIVAGIGAPPEIIERVLNPKE